MNIRLGAWSLTAILVAAGAGAASPDGGPPIDARRYTRTLFEDEFQAKALGSEWKLYKSASTIREGVLVGIEPPKAGHASVNSVNVDAVGDILVELSFKFEGAKRFTVAFNDKMYKGAHAGHICRVSFDAKSLTYQDGKTGVFNNEIYEKRKKSRKGDPTLNKLLATKRSTVKRAFEKGKWYALSVRIQGDRIQAFIDGVPQGDFRSEGIAHATKRNVALVTSGREMHLDHLKIRATPAR